MHPGVVERIIAGELLPGARELLAKRVKSIALDERIKKLQAHVTLLEARVAALEKQQDYDRRIWRVFSNEVRDCLGPVLKGGE